jgi:hypothetical protein
MEALAGSGVWVGMVIGFLAGVAFQAFRQALQNLRKTRESIPGFKKTVSGTRRRAAFWLLVSGGYAAIVLLVIIQL